MPVVFAQPNGILDEYYKPNKFRAAQTPLRYILSVPAYRWAYYVAIFSILIYVVVYARRQQRIIPIIEPFKNLSLEFARTVGTLYYQQKDHRDLAEKKNDLLFRAGAKPLLPGH
jgi:hypothetical protein